MKNEEFTPVVVQKLWKSEFQRVPSASRYHVIITRSRHIDRNLEYSPDYVLLIIVTAMGMDPSMFTWLI